MELLADTDFSNDKETNAPIPVGAIALSITAYSLDETDAADALIKMSLKESETPFVHWQIYS